jgi:hypothetical protein
MTAPNRHQVLQNFLAVAPVDNPSHVQHLLEHISQCGECAERLMHHKGHLLALLNAAQELEPPSPMTSLDLVRATHNELVLIARRLLGRSPSLSRRLGDGRPPKGAGAYLWDTTTTVAEIRVALAVSETALTVSSLLANRVESESEIGTLDSSGLVFDEGGRTPASYFHAIIASYAEVSVEDAALLWKELVAFMIDSKTGLPGLYVSGGNDKQLDLMLIHEFAA